MTETKYDKAVKRAQDKAAGTELATTTPGALDVSTLPSGMLVESSSVATDLAAKIASGEWEQAPQLLSLKRGQTVIAVLEGNGPPAEFADESTGIVKEVKTWILSRDGVRVSILSSVQLDKKLPPFVGGMVAITRGEDIRNGTALYTDYLVLGPKRADGQPRDWASRPQLPAGTSS